MLPFGGCSPESRRVAEQFGEPSCRACRAAHRPRLRVARPDRDRRRDLASADRGPSRTGSSPATRRATNRSGRTDANERSPCIGADKPSPPRPTPPLCCGTCTGRRSRPRPPETSTLVHATLGQTHGKAARPCRWLPRTRPASIRDTPGRIMHAARSALLDRLN